MNEKIRSFTDLNSWKEAHQFVLMIYKISKNFPPDEKFGLTNQIQRAAVSITSNIAEGFSRKSKKEKTQFFHISLGSLTEVQNQLLIARDLKYIDSSQFSLLAKQSVVVSKLVNGLLKSVKTLSSTHS